MILNCKMSQSLGAFLQYFHDQFNIYRCTVCSPTPFTTLTKSLFDYEQTDYDYDSTNSNSRSDSNDLYEQKWWELQEIVPQDIVVIEAKEPSSNIPLQEVTFTNQETSLFATSLCLH